MIEIEGENDNEHLIENSCTLLWDYIEWTRTLVVFLDYGCNSVVHPCLSPESWLVLSVHVVKESKNTRGNTVSQSIYVRRSVTLHKLNSVCLCSQAELMKIQNL